MEDFKGMSRDTVREKNPAGTWEFARNILISKGFLSITNENGFDYKHDIPGIFIGKIETNEEIVYFSVDGNYSCIGLYRTNEPIPVYEPILRTQYLGFKLNRPIEGVFFYNFKGELIVSFCDGVFIDSNTPKLINLNNIGVALTGGYELVDPTDVDRLELFPHTREQNMFITYDENSFVDIEVAYITYCYIIDDNNSTSPYFPIHTVAYPMTSFKRELNRTINILIALLDDRYNKIKLGIIVVKEGGMFAYESSPIPYGEFNAINYILSSLTNFTETAIDNLVIPSITYSRINTLTINNNYLVAGNLVSDNETKFQKYANLLKLRLDFDLKPIEQKTTPSLCPDEVYSFTISLQKLDGNYTEEFHIPGEGADYFDIPNDLDPLTVGDLASMGLVAADIPNSSSLKRFHVINSGGWVDNSFNKPSLGTPEAELRWGCWQNEENYPDNIEYDGTIDYEGDPIVGGEDLRNTPVRYHRVPGLDRLVIKFPCLLGYTEENIYEAVTWPPSSFRGAIPAFAVSVSNFDSIVPIPIKKQYQGYRLSIVKRRADSSLVQDISFLDTTIETYETPESTIGQFHVSANAPNTTFYPRLAGSPQFGIVTDFNRFKDVHFGYSSIKSVNLLINKPKINASIVKANYAFINNNYSSYSGKELVNTIKDSTVDDFTGNIGAIGNSTLDFIQFSGSPIVVPSYYMVSEIQRYATIKEVRYLPPNANGFNTFGGEEGVFLKANNSLQSASNSYKWNPLLVPPYTKTFNDEMVVGTDTEVGLFGFNSGVYTFGLTHFPAIGISATFLRVLKNVYVGLNPTEFITIGRVSIAPSGGVAAAKFRYNGDVFTNNCYSLYHTKYSYKDFVNKIVFSPFQYLVRGMISPTNNAQVYNDTFRVSSSIVDPSFIDNPTQDAGLLEANLENYQIVINTDLKTEIYNKIFLASLNDLITGIAFNINNTFTNYFPFRVHKSSAIQNENLSTNNVRRFLANNYTDMLNDRGEIIALRGSNKTLYIQQEFSLFVASIKDRLSTKEGVSYLGEADIFDRSPDEVMDASNKGYLGSSSKFACILYRDGYVTLDQVKGKMYIISGTQGLEISKEGMINWMEQNANTDEKYYNLNRLGIKQVVDNPYTQVGHIIGFDVKYNRLLWTKKDYRFKEENLEEDDEFTFNGEYYFVNDEIVYYTNLTWF